MISDITIGQFFPGKSFLHKMDPRVKILLLTAYIVFIFCAFNYAALAVIGLSVMLTVAFSGVPVKMYFKGFKTILFVLMFTTLINLFYGTGEPLWQWGIIKITASGINNAIFVILRIICLILMSCVLTYTTSPTDLTDALERLMKPLKVFKVKVHEIAMMMTIALRFIPTLLEETEKIMNAQKARGANMDTGNFVQRVKALIPVLIPLFVSAFRRAYDLATAMECRCYHGGEGRTRMKVLKLKKTDFLYSGIAVLIFIGVIICNIIVPPVLR